MTSSQDKLVLSYFDVVLRESDLRLLENAIEWINDNIISFFFEVMHRQVLKSDARVLLMAPQVTQLVKYASMDLDSESRKALLKDVFKTEDELELILFPLNDHDIHSMRHGGHHWSLLVLHDKSFTHFDSSPSSGHEYDARVVAEVVSGHLFGDETTEVKKGVCLRQDNGYDCGIHVMANAEGLCRRWLHGEEIIQDYPAGLSHITMMRKNLLSLIRQMSHN